MHMTMHMHKHTHKLHNSKQQQHITTIITLSHPVHTVVQMWNTEISLESKRRQNVKLTSISNGGSLNAFRNK